MRKQNMSSPSPVTDGTHVWVMTGTGRPQGVRLRGQGAVGARHSEGLRRASALNGATGRRRCCSRTRSTCRCCTACTPTIRRTCCGSSKATGKTIWRVERPTPARAASRPTRTRRRPSLGTARPAEIVVSGGDVVTGHDPATGAGAVARRRAQSDATTAVYRIVASPVVHGEIDLSRRRASGRCWR